MEGLPLLYQTVMLVHCLSAEVHDEWYVWWWLWMMKDHQLREKDRCGWVWKGSKKTHQNGEVSKDCCPS